MCGICGVALSTEAAAGASGPLADVAGRMVDRLVHRGPDDRGVHAFGRAALGHTRLSILDLSPAGHQPMLAPHRPVAISYNGEVYNFRALRRELEGRGHRFSSTSDTEVVLHAYLEWGTDAFRRLEGMFGIAVWDDAEGRLVLARDRLGIKPVYYELDDRGLRFGSEIKAILAAGPARREMSWAALHEFMWYGNALGEETMFAGIRRLPPGAFLTYDGCEARVERYWRLEEVPQLDVGRAEAAAGVRERLESAVRSHLVSDVPVGIFLSGGIDSTAITAFASRHAAEPLDSYSVGFDMADAANELPVAARMARLFGTRHHEVRVRADASREVVERLVRAHDEPFADAANIPLYLLCEQLRGTAKVVLQGDGGDELFAGYRRYAVLSFERLWVAAARGVGPLLRMAPPGPLRDRGLRFADAMRPADGALRSALLLTEDTPRRTPLRLLSAEVREQLRGHDPFRAYREEFARFERLDPVQRMLHIDMRILLPATYLEKVDKATMAHGIEVRVPFLDAGLVDYAAGLPSALKVRGAEKKWILREALRGTVPDEVLDAPKSGFGVPFGSWLAGPLASYLREVFADDSVRRWGVFDHGAVGEAIEEHTSGRRNNGYLLWKSLQLALWRREYLEGAVVGAAGPG